MYIANYVENRKELAWKMHGILMDWQIQVHSRFKILSESLYICVSLIDRYHSCYLWWFHSFSLFYTQLFDVKYDTIANERSWTLCLVARRNCTENRSRHEHDFAHFPTSIYELVMMQRRLTQRGWHHQLGLKPMSVRNASNFIVELLTHTCILSVQLWYNIHVDDYTATHVRQFNYVCRHQDVHLAPFECWCTGQYGLGMDLADVPIWT